MFKSKPVSLFKLLTEKETGFCSA